MSAAAPMRLPELKTIHAADGKVYEFVSNATVSDTTASFEYRILNGGDKAANIQWRSIFFRQMLEAGKEWNGSNTLTLQGSVRGILDRPVQYDHWSPIRDQPSVSITTSSGTTTYRSAPAYIARGTRWFVFAKSLPKTAVGLVKFAMKCFISEDSPGLELISEATAVDPTEMLFEYSYTVRNVSGHPMYVRWGTNPHVPDFPSHLDGKGSTVTIQTFKQSGPVGVLSDIVMKSKVSDEGMKFGRGRQAKEMSDFWRQLDETGVLKGNYSMVLAPMIVPELP